MALRILVGWWRRFILLGVSQKSDRSAFTVTDSSSILLALVGLKDVRVLYFQRDRHVVSLGIEQRLENPLCPQCKGPAWVKDRLEVSYIDLPTL